MAHLAFHGGAHHEGTDADGQFAQAGAGALVRVGDVAGRGQPHAAAHRLAVHAADHEHRCLADGVDHQREAAEELPAGVRVVDGQQLVETSARTEGLAALAAQHDHAHVRVLAGVLDGLGHGTQDGARQAVALGVVEGDGGDALRDVRLDVAVVHGPAKERSTRLIRAARTPRPAPPGRSRSGSAGTSRCAPSPWPCGAGCARATRRSPPGPASRR